VLATEARNVQASFLEQNVRWGKRSGDYRTSNAKRALSAPACACAACMYAASWCTPIFLPFLPMMPLR